MSINYRLIRELKEELKEYVKEKIAAGLVKYGAYARSTASGEGDKIRGYQTEGADETNYDFDGRRVFPFGIRSRPPTGVWGVWIGKGGRSGDGVIVGAESSRYGPGNLNDGEVCIYNKVNGCTILLDQSGNVVITPASGKTVQIAGNSYSLLLTDTFLTDLKAALGSILASNTGGNIVNDALAAIQVVTGKINSGAYKSTVAKNG